MKTQRRRHIKQPMVGGNWRCGRFFKPFFKTQCNKKTTVQPETEAKPVTNSTTTRAKPKLDTEKDVDDMTAHAIISEANTIIEGAQITAHTNIKKATLQATVILKAAQRDAEKIIKTAQIKAENIIKAAQLEPESDAIKKINADIAAERNRSAECSKELTRMRQYCSDNNVSHLNKQIQMLTDKNDILTEANTRIRTIIETYDKDCLLNAELQVENKELKQQLAELQKQYNKLDSDCNKIALAKDECEYKLALLNK